MKAATVIVTKQCKRRCPGCYVRELVEGFPVKKFEDLFEYDEIVLRGGEIMAISERAVELVHRLRLQGYEGKIYIQTSDVSRLKKYWAVKMLIDETDGICYTLHTSNADKVKADLRSVRSLEEYLGTINRKGKIDELCIDERLYKEEYAQTFKHLAPLSLPVRKKGEPLPESIEFIYYDLEGEG